MKQETLKIIQCVSLFSFLCLVIGLETVYRNPLFTQSLKWIAEWQKDSPQSENDFFSVISEFGAEPLFIPLLFIIFLWFPLNKSYSFISTIIYSVYVDSLFKLIYRNPRPFWVEPTLFKKCDGGFSNPSGHALSSTAIYLALWNIITDFPIFNNSFLGIFFRILILIFFISLIFTIMISRVYLGVHAVNHLLYGSSLGFVLYYFIFHIVQVNKLKAKEFFDWFRNIFFIFFFSLWFGILILVAFLIWALVKNEVKKEWEDSLKNKCPDLKLYRSFNNESLFGMLLIFVLIGAHYGMVLLVQLSDKKFPNKEEEIICWYRGTFFNQLFRFLLFIPFVSPIALSLGLPGTLSLGIIFTFKVSIPYLLSAFDLYGPLVYCSILLKIANPKEIYVQNENNGLNNYLKGNRMRNISLQVQNNDLENNRLNII